MTQTADCPLGTVVVGGGASAVDDAGATDGALPLTGLVPLHSDRGDRYVATAELLPGISKPWALIAYAICAAPVPGYQLVSATTAVSSAPFKVIAARCPGGTATVGTGGTINNPAPRVWLQLTRTSTPLDVARVTARADDGYVGFWTVTSWAICTGFIGVSETMTVMSTRDGSHYNGLGCPAGTFVHCACGGGSLVDSGPYWLQAVLPASDLRSVWVAMTGPVNDGMYIQAICAR
jgi:hypothetical protein